MPDINNKNDTRKWPLDQIGKGVIVRMSYLQRGQPEGAPKDTTEKKVIMLCDNHPDFWITVDPMGEITLVKKTFVFDKFNTAHWDYLDQFIGK